MQERRGFARTRPPPRQEQRGPGHTGRGWPQNGRRKLICVVRAQTEYMGNRCCQGGTAVFSRKEQGCKGRSSRRGNTECHAEQGTAGLQFLGSVLKQPLPKRYAEHIMRNTRLDEAQVGIKTARRNINNLRYADDTTLMAESEEELKSFLIKVKEESEKVGLKLNIQKTKITASLHGK